MTGAIRRVLIADDDRLAREFISEFLEMKGVEAVCAENAAEAFRLLVDRGADMVLTDLRMPGDDGLTLLRRIRNSGRELPVVVMTAYGSVDTAVEALKSGALDFLTKPLSPEKVEDLLERVSQHLDAERPAEEKARMTCAVPRSHVPLIGRSQALRSLVDTTIRVARSRATVLITGESGTGKELFARLIHQESPRHERPFVRVNCAALAESLLESELFGHERGAFTGAVGRRQGRFELADTGTIFLDEIAETSPALQAKLLRVLEEREFERVGGTKTLVSDVRTVAATNQDLEERIGSGSFREDLFYRLQVVNLRVPPLRDRREDIPELADHFVKRYARENGFQVESISDRAIQILCTYHWPGNVRELENSIERAVVLDPGRILHPEHITLGVTEAKDGPDVSRHVGYSLENVERALILRTLESTGNSRKDAAEILGVTARTLTNKIARYRKQGIHVGAPRRRSQEPQRAESSS
ncbi:MAG: sigma-54 dependent transcriptional regulator [Planctomycetota bacterium]